MADARLRSLWLGQMRFDDLSDHAWRVFTSALMWSVGNGTDGVIPKRYLRYLHPVDVPEAVRVELVHAGLWTEQGDTFVMVDWAGVLGQSTSEQIEKYREGTRERKRRQRERAKQRAEAQEGGPDDQGAQTEGVTSAVTRDVTRDVTGGVGNGKGNGNGEGIEENTDSERELVSSWPVVKIPQYPSEPIERTA